MKNEHLQRFAVANHLRRNPDTTQSAIADATGLTKSQVKAIVDEYRSDGHVALDSRAHLYWVEVPEHKRRQFWLGRPWRAAA